MFRPRIIPVLLLKNKGLVKTRKFDKNSARYIGDPINAVKIFNDLEADELVFLDILASQEKRTIDPGLVKKIGDEAFMPFAVGGGIRTVGDIKMLLNAGAEKVVLNTISHENTSMIRAASVQFGHQSIIISVDYKKNLFGKFRVFILDGTESINDHPVDFALRMQECGAGEILLHSIDRDGMMNGYDLDLIEQVSEKLLIPVIACGGAGSPADLRKATDRGASAVAAGSLFVYHGPRNAVLINYPEQQELLKIFE